MKTSEIKAKTDAELQQELEASLREKFNLLLQSGTGEKSKAHNFKNVRRTIARIKTVLWQRAQEKHE